MKRKVTAFFIAVYLVFSLFLTTGAANISESIEFGQPKEIIVIKGYKFEVKHRELEYVYNNELKEFITRVNIDIYSENENASVFLRNILTFKTDDMLSEESLTTFNQLTSAGAFNREEPMQTQNIICYLTGFHAGQSYEMNVVVHGQKPCYRDYYVGVKCSRCGLILNLQYIATYNLSCCK